MSASRLPYPKIALGSFVSYVFAHNIGVSLLTGGTVRYRIYSAEGMSSVDIAVITLVCTINFALGSTVIVGIALLVEPAAVVERTGVADPAAQGGRRRLPAGHRCVPGLDMDALAADPCSGNGKSSHRASGCR